MEVLSISSDQILRKTLFHIQIKQCQYIDDFPEAVTSVFKKMIDKNGMKDFKDIKRKLYRIDTSFFQINKDKIRKRDFYESLYDRIASLSEES